MVRGFGDAQGFRTSQGIADLICSARVLSAGTAVLDPVLPPSGFALWSASPRRSPRWMQVSGSVSPEVWRNSGLRGRSGNASSSRSRPNAFGQELTVALEEGLKSVSRLKLTLARGWRCVEPAASVRTAVWQGRRQAVHRS